jgi:hypothetical protein
MLTRCCLHSETPSKLGTFDLSFFVLRMSYDDMITLYLSDQSLVTNQS